MLLHPWLHHQQRQRSEHAFHRQHQCFQRSAPLLLCCKDLFQRVGICFGVQTGRSAAQRAHGALLPHGGGDLLQQRADVGALGAAHRQHILVFCRTAAVLDAVDLNGARLALHGHALARQLIQRLAVDLDCRVHGRHLHLRADKLRQHSQQFLLSGGDGCNLQHRAGAVAGIGACTQAQGGAVSLVVVQLQVHRLAGTAAEHRQNAGSHGVQRTAVPQLACTQHAAQLCHHVKAGPVHGLVYDQDALHHASSCGASSSASTSARIAFLAFSRSPSSSQPAARVWPPPPSRRAMAQASTPFAVRTLMR